MPRNGSGVETIPNTFSPNTVISSSEMNANFTDVANELTNSLALDGQSVMTGQFKAANGSVSAPSMTFGTDLDTGLYRVGANDLGLAVAGVLAEDWSATVHTLGLQTAYPAAVTVASATTTDILGAAADDVVISGTTTITSLGTGIYRYKRVRFSGVLTLTHNSTTLILPGGANITTANGDTMEVVSDGSSNARVIRYTRGGVAPLPSGAASLFGGQYIHVTEEQAQNTDGGTFTNGADRTRALNAIRGNPLGAGLTSNQITGLLAGNYLAWGYGTAFAVAEHQTFLYDATSAAEISNSRGADAYADTTTGQTSSLIGFKPFTLATTSAIELRHRCTTTKATNGFGRKCNFGVEVYAELIVWKIG